MKRLRFLAFFFLSLAIITTSCKKDDDPTNNKFSYDGSTYTLEKGFLNDLGSNATGTQTWQVFLTSSGVDIVNFSYKGSGEVVYLDLNNISTDSLVSGTYNWSDTRKNFSMVPDTEIFVDFGFGTSEGTKVLATGGSADVTVNGDEVTIDFTLTLENGKTVTGDFSGLLQDL